MKLDHGVFRHRIADEWGLDMGRLDGRHAEKNAYLVVTRGLLDRSGKNRVSDGAKLARRCLAPLMERPDRGDYPPQLLVLLATVGFQPFDELLKGIADELARRGLSVPLVGCSVAGVLTEEKAMPKGAALVCLSSRFIRARVGVARDVLDHRRKGVASLVHQLGLRAGHVNPQGNRFLLCFLPGFLETVQGRRYEAAEILAAIRSATRNRIPMVGGVAGDDYRREGSWQFAEGTVHMQSAVTALIESDLPFGMAMAHGLVPTRKYVYVKDVADRGHRIVKFVKAAGKTLLFQSPKEVIDECQRKFGHKILLGMATSEDEGEQVVLLPQLQADGSALVNRPVKRHWPLEVLASVPEKLHGTASEMIERALIAGNIDRFHLACILGFPCVARSTYARALKLDVARALKTLRDSHPGVPLVAGLVFGEVGLGVQGRPVLGSWTISGLLLGDQIAVRSLQRLGYHTLAGANGHQAAEGKPRPILATAESIEDVLAAAIDAVTEIGFPGSMISLVFHDRKSYVVVAQKAHSQGWRKIIPLTVRRAKQRDLLNKVGESGRPLFIPDSREDPLNDHEAVLIGNVVSQYVLPLKGTDGKLIGLLQVDLGDMRHRRQLPEHLAILLQAFASQIATALSRAIRMHELALLDLFDRAVAASLPKPTVADAAQEFVDTVVGQRDLFRTDMVHIRLASDDGRFLRLVAGSGNYYQVARKTRPVISVDDNSPSAIAFRNADPMWVNNVEDDVPSTDFIAGFRRDPMGRVLRTQRSFVNLPIRAGEKGSPVGIMNIAATMPWFFSESLWRSLKTLGQRLFFVIQHAKEVESERRTARERQFLLGMTPPLSSQDLRTSLRDHADRIARAAAADVVSFFLWDPERRLLVLRGQHGWKKNMIGKATYRRCSPEHGDSMTGTVAGLLQPEYIPDLEAWKRDHGMGGAEAKYGTEMFGRHLHSAYEVIAIPLHFGDLLGVLTMHNATYPGDSASRFATTTREALTEVARDISAFVFATQAHEATSYREQRATRLENFGRFLLKPSRDAVQLAARASSQLKNAYPVGAAAIYLAGEDPAVLSLAGSAGLSRSVDDRSSLTDIVVRGTALGRVFEDGEKLLLPRDDKGQLDETIGPLGRLLPSGRIRSFLALPLRDDFRKPLGVLAVWNIRNRAGEEYPRFTDRDITEFTRLASCIARAIDRRTTDTKRLEVANELRDSERRLLYGAAIVGHLTHDLRNRMNEILSDVRTLVDDAHDDTERERLTSVEGICGGLAKRVDEHLDAIARGGVRQHEDFDLHRTLQRVLWRSEEKAKRQGVTIHVMASPGVILRGSEMDFEEAFFNIADNGINAMEDGGKLTIRVSVKRAKRRVCITIADTGEGMTKEETAKALGGFYKTGRRTRPAMGLFLAKFVIERHGGTFLLDSKLKKGTTVSLSLPVQFAGD